MLFSRRTVLALLFVVSMLVGFAVARYVVPRYAPEIGKFYASEGDADDDGVPDGNDNCPDDYNPSQNDNDNDGIGNRCDPTPNGDEAGPDDDLDGFSNDVDNCPNDFNPAQNDCDGDGIGNICDDHPGCNGGGGGDGGGSCDKSKLSASFNGGTVTITNSGDGACDVHATSWEVYDRFLPEFLDSQVRVSAPQGTVGANKSIELSVTIPDCSHQVDAGVGSPPNDAHYGSNYIDGQIRFTDFLCDGTCIGDSCQPTVTTPPPPPTNNPPIGSFDQADCTDVRGWARDQDTDPLPSDNNGPVQVQIWNGPAQTNSTNLLAQVVANQPREAAVGNHAFVWPIPAGIKDGRMLNLYVYAIDNQNPAVSTLLTGSPRAVDTQQCLPPTSHMACENNACIFVVGPGTSTCATNADCNPTHLSCVNNACTPVAGAGTDTCTDNASCATPTHMACVSNACSSVTGAGTDQCSTNADCITPPPLACTPATQSASSGQEVTITATGGTRPFAWTALNGNPATGGDNPLFKVTFVNTTDPSRTFPVNVTDAADGAATCTVTVACPQAVCNPSPGCTYQNGNRCSCGTLVCPSNSPFSCAPPSQTISVGDTADFQTGGGTSPYTWTAPGSSQLSPNGSRASARYNQPGSYSVQVRDGQGRTAVCTVTAEATTTPPPPTSPALSIQKTVRIYPTGSEQESVTANPSQTVEFAIRVSSNGSGTATQVTVRDTLPPGLTYQAGTTTVDNVPAADGIIGSGLALGDMVPGRTITIRFRALLAPAQFFGGGITILTNIAYARASNIGEMSDTAQVRVGTITQVQTGPGETAGLALIVSAIVTLLYVGYASTEKFRFREAVSSAKQAQKDADMPDFKR